MSEIEKINRFARRTLTEDEVYRFDVILCDNDIDRDLECFSESALKQMQELFIGKTGIFDHDPRSSEQTARIYDACLVRDPQKKTKDGRTYVSLRASAYMIRTQSNADLIREIDGGIKKEVSVSCSAGKQVCSICGADRRVSDCNHIAGRTYGDKTCHTILEDIRDAYEWSFVAVPAQVRAGVTKGYRKEDVSMLKEELQKHEKVLQEVEQQLRGEVMQLCARNKGGAVSKALCSAAGKMDIEELLHFKQELLAECSENAEIQLLSTDASMTAFRMG